MIENKNKNLDFDIFYQEGRILSVMSEKMAEQRALELISKLDSSYKSGKFTFDEYMMLKSNIIKNMAQSIEHRIDWPDYYIFE